MQLASFFRFSQYLLLGLSLSFFLSACGPKVSNTATTELATNSPTTSSDTSRSRMPTEPSLKSLYIQSCYGCHSSGAAGAPRSGDAEQWALRLQKGMDTLLTNTISGINSMPPKGMCMNCSDDDFRALILFLSGEAE